MMILPKAAGCISLACAKDTNRYATSAVRVITHLDDQWWLEACNGKILAIARGPRLQSGGGPEVDVAEPLSEFLLAQHDWEKIFKNIDLRGIGKGCVALIADEDQIHVSTPNGVLLFPHLAGGYPDVMQVLPKEGSACTLTLDPWLLMDLLKIAIGIGESRDGARVTLHFYGAGKPMCVTTRNVENSNTLDGLIMPLTPG